MNWPADQTNHIYPGPIGTPPNATAVKFLAESGYDVTFGEWALRMIPYVIIMILIAWVLLQVLFPFKSKEIKLEIPETRASANASIPESPIVFFIK